MVEENEHRSDHSKIAQANQIKYLKEEKRWTYKKIAELYRGGTQDIVRNLYLLSQISTPLLEFVNRHEEYSTALSEMVKFNLTEEQQSHISNLLLSAEASDHNEAAAAIGAGTKAGN